MCLVGPLNCRNKRRYSQAPFHTPGAERGCSSASLAAPSFAGRLSGEVKGRFSQRARFAAYRQESKMNPVQLVSVPLHAGAELAIVSGRAAGGSGRASANLKAAAVPSAGKQMRSPLWSARNRRAVRLACKIERLGRSDVTHSPQN